MEQQKILWITLSVAILLLVVLGAGLFMFSPASGGEADDSQLASARVISPEEFDPIEWAQKDEGYPGIEEEEKETSVEESEFVVVYGEAEKKEDVSKEGAEAPTVAKEPVKKKPAPVKPVPVKKKTVPVKKAPAKKTPEKKVPVKKLVKKVNVTEYWIQTGAFSSVASAEKAKQTLVLKGFTPTIQTKDVSGKDYYRVRIGPYPSKEEAEKFLHWVKGVDGFIESYVSKVYTKR